MRADVWLWSLCIVVGLEPTFVPIQLQVRMGVSRVVVMVVVMVVARVIPMIVVIFVARIVTKSVTMIVGMGVTRVVTRVVVMAVVRVVAMVVGAVNRDATLDAFAFTWGLNMDVASATRDINMDIGVADMRIIDVVVRYTDMVALVAVVKEFTVMISWWGVTSHSVLISRYTRRVLRVIWIAIWNMI